MTIAGNHLSRSRVGLQSQQLAGQFFDFRIDIGVGSDGTGNLSHGDRLFQSAEAIAIPQHFRQPACEFKPKGNRLRVNTVRSTDHDGVAVLLSLVTNGLDTSF